MANSITADEIREQFSQAMSAMYQQEVPQYGTLLELVADVNLAVLENNPQLHEKMVNADELARLNVERHGAIRVGTAQELATLRRMFAIMGMYPVSYYDLSQAGVPVHSTAFRPIDDASLARNPFRVFTSLLRLELIENEILRQKAAEILRQRDIFTPRCRQLLEEYEQQGGFNETQAQEFVQEALETFRWHQSATVDEETYRALRNENRLIADVVCFPGCPFQEFFACPDNRPASFCRNGKTGGRSVDSSDQKQLRIKTADPSPCRIKSTGVHSKNPIKTIQNAKSAVSFPLPGNRTFSFYIFHRRKSQKAEPFLGSAFF